MPVSSGQSYHHGHHHWLIQLFANSTSSGQAHVSWEEPIKKMKTRKRTQYPIKISSSFWYLFLKVFRQFSNICVVNKSFLVMTDFPGSLCDFVWAFLGVPVSLSVTDIFCFWICSLRWCHSLWQRTCVQVLLSLLICNKMWSMSLCHSFCLNCEIAIATIMRTLQADTGIWALCQALSAFWHQCSEPVFNNDALTWTKLVSRTNIDIQEK